jgi:transposase
MRMRDELGPLFGDPLFAPLFPARGRPAEDPARLALITIMQFAEGLSDRQTADGVRSRIDWKYALALELTDPGFDASVLSEFRARLIGGRAEVLLFEAMLTRLGGAGLLRARGRQRTDSTHVLASIRMLNRLECVGETLRRALNALAVVAPDWLRGWVPAPWFDRYGRRFEEYRLPPGRAERYALAETIGPDGVQLLAAIYDPGAPGWLRAVPAVEVLRQVWVQQFYAPEAGRVRWRSAEDLPPSAVLITSPYDSAARYSKKRGTEWTGYKVHLTETCDDDLPPSDHRRRDHPGHHQRFRDDPDPPGQFGPAGPAPVRAPPGRGLCHRRASGQQPEGASGGARRPGGRRQQLAGPGS